MTKLQTSPASTKALRVELNAKFQQAADSVNVGNQVIAITPPIDEDYWIARVPLYRDQAIVCFPKFFTVGCGFAKEEDWNTNLPLSCTAEKIFNHIKHNKKYARIPNARCVEAIQLLQNAVLPMYGKKVEPSL